VHRRLCGEDNDVDLQTLANQAFDAIKANTGLEFPHGTVAEAFESFQSITGSKGLPWLICATTGTGMSQVAWATWMTEARKVIEAAA